MLKLINKQVFRTIFMFVVMAVIAFFSADIVQASGTSNSPLDVMDATSVKPLQKQRNSQDKFPVQKLPKLLSKRESILQGASNPYVSTDIEITYDDSGNQTATVYNAKGLLEAIFDPANPGYSFKGNDSWDKAEKDGDLYNRSYLDINTNKFATEPVSKIHKIILAKDINLCDVPSDTNNNIAGSYRINIPPTNQSNGSGQLNGMPSYKYVPIRHDKLTICTPSDSQQINLNMGFNNFALTGDTNRGPQSNINGNNTSSYPYKEDWTIKNLNIYGTSYWGFVSCNTGVADNHELAHSKVGQPDPTNPDHILAGKTDETRIAQAAAGKIGGYSWLTYENTNYIGSQFAWTGNGTSGTTIKGTVYVNSVFSYKIPSTMNNSSYIWLTYSNGNQQNFQVDRAVFDKDSHFYGSTYDGDAFDVTGSVKLNSGATVDVYPHGYVGDGLGPEDDNLYLGWGFYFNGSVTNSKPRLDLYGNSKLNIHCNTKDGNDVFGKNGNWESGVSNDEETEKGSPQHKLVKATSGALDMVSDSSIIAYHETKDEDGKMLSPEINIDSDGPIYGNHQLVNFGGGNAELSHGKFSIDAKNLNNASNDGWHYKNTPSSGTGGLMTVSGKANITVKTGGDFSIAAHNKTANDSSGYPVNLLYYFGGQINLMNPKNVSLDLRDNNDPDSALVYAPNEIKINAYDTRVQAWGDNKLDGNGNGVDKDGKNSKLHGYLPSNIDYKYDQIISLGMGDTSDPNNNGGKCKSDPIRAQTLTLPFNQYAIDFMQYLQDPTNNVIQGYKDDLDLLKAAMIQMNGREFRYVRLSDLPGPTEDGVNKVSVPGANIDQQEDIKNITGQVGGDYWANDDESDQTLFNPVPPLLRVQLKHKDSDSLIDLGTMPNSKAAQEKTNADPTNSSVTEVTPNLIDSNRNIRTDDKGNYMIGTKVTTANDTSNTNPQPHYLDPKDSSIVTWDKNGWSKDTSSSENDPQHSFSYNLQDVIKKYNENHTDKKISFQPGDQVLTSVVTNYQETPVQNTRITNLYLKKGDEPKTPFLIGDQIKMPFQYIDTNTGAYKLFLSGTIYKLVNDDDGIITRKEVCTFNKQQVDRKQSNGWETNSLNLPIEPTSKPGATSEPGNYVVEFYGTDDVGDSGNAGPDDPISWQYTVSNLPKYNGKKVLNDHTTGDTTKPGNIVSNLYYTVKTVFEAVNTTNGALSKVMFNHPDTIGDGIDNRDTNIEENSDYTLTASYIDKGQTINKQLNSGFEYNTKYYSPGDFGINTDNFPAGVKFTITHKILVNAENKDDGVQIGADQMYSKEGNDGEDILLGTSNSIQYNSVGSIVLNVVNNKIDYGTNPVAVPLKKERVFFIPKAQDPIVSVANYTPYSQPIILTAQVDGDTSGLNSLNNWLYYRKTKDNTGYSDTPMTNKVTVFHDSVGTNVSQNISSRWFNKDGKQVTGPILKLRQNSSPTPGKYSTKITWNLTNSL